MASEDSLVTADLDFERDGRHFGHLAVPHSRDESAWGSVLVPIVCIKNGAGRTILFTGGSHGDEYEGPVTLLDLARELEPAHVQGRVIIMPALNLPALEAGRRLSPIDGMNMNRAFPGDPRGPVTAKIAHYVASRLLPLADVVVDLHSGGRSLLFVPSAIVHDLPDERQMAETLAALAAFAAPVGLVLEELDSNGMLDSAVEAMGKVFVSTELGGGGMLSPAALAVGRRGVRNLLAHFGVADLARAPAPAPGRIMETPGAEHFVIAGAQGLYEPLVELGDEVARGQPVGRIHDIGRPDAAPEVYAAGAPGTLIARRAQGWAARGDCLGVVARDR